MSAPGFASGPEGGAPAPCRPAPRPMRPMDLGDLLDEAVVLYRENAACFYGIVLLINLVIFAIENALDMEAQNRALFAALAGVTPSTLRDTDLRALSRPALAIWCFFLLRFLLTQLSMAALTVAASRRFLGESAGILSSYAAALPRFPVLLGTGMLAGLIYTAACGALVVPGMILMAAFAFAPLVVVLEHGRPAQSLKRSLTLTLLRPGARRFRHPLFKISMILTIFTLVSLAAYALAGTPRGLIYGWYYAQGMRADLVLPIAVEKTLRVIEYLGITAAEPLGMTALVLLYYDQRMRTEGFDLERLAQGLRPAGKGAGPP